MNICFFKNITFFLNFSLKIENYRKLFVPGVATVIYFDSNKTDLGFETLWALVEIVD